MSKGAAYWDTRYAAQGFAYGEIPNDFLKARFAGKAAGQVQGRAISLCEGEGRNAVFLAQLGFQVTAVDFSEVGLQKARALAARHGVQLDCIVTDMADLDLGTNQWDLVIAIFAQPESSTRQRLYRQLGHALRRGGQLVLETKVESGATAQDRYPGIDILKVEISPLETVFAQQADRLLDEGTYHQGMHHTAQIVAVRR
jgi:SAM-dependent methyltransferase